MSLNTSSMTGQSPITMTLPSLTCTRFGALCPKSDAFTRGAKTRIAGAGLTSALADALASVSLSDGAKTFETA